VALEDRITISMPEGGELELQLAGLGSRFIAFTVDLIIQLLVIVVLVLVTGGTSGGVNLDQVVLVIGVFVVWFGYPIAFELLARGRTPGKRLTHLRVVRDQGEAVDLPASVIRNLVRVFDGPTLLCLPSIAAILATQYNQRPGDIAAGTLVIRDTPLSRRPEGSQSIRASSALRPDWDVSSVSAEELATVRGFLARRETFEREARAALARRLADGLAQKVAGATREGSAEEFLEALVELKLERSGDR
jgi:uncharacterized RDD family membrane protein YckC